mmetsp:Transcript_10851/g.24208  ORF Transcript_10851/g.24208 Transcript_10851/m.24208 type:complete len:149 (-) Transcript_10851:212-658(-)
MTRRRDRTMGACDSCPTVPRLLRLLVSAHQKLVVAVTQRRTVRRGRSLYRGIRVNVASKYQVGKDVTWWGVSSCTTKISTAVNFGGGRGTLFHIRAQTAVPVARWSAHRSEDEYILAPGTVLRVTRVEPQGKKANGAAAAQIHLQEVR